MAIRRIIGTFISFLPFVEIILFIIVGKYIGLGMTLLLIIITTVIGAIILQTRGFVNLNRMFKRIQKGEHPAVEMLDGSLVMFAGVLLVLPGFVTDAVGLVLLVPPLREIVIRQLIDKGLTTPAKKKSASGDVIEGEYWRENDKVDKKDD